MNYTKHKEIKVAVDVLVRGYEEELNLYQVVRDLSLEQKALLDDPGDMTSLYELLERKEDVLGLVGLLESEMAGARTLVMAQSPAECPHRLRLAAVLASVQDMIEEIREMERHSADMLERVPA